VLEEEEEDGIGESKINYLYWEEVFLKERELL